jgi:hypothetical protein
MTTQQRGGEMDTQHEAVAPPELAPMAPPPPPARDFPWMRVPTQRGMRPKPGPEGLRLELVDVGDYGYVPDVWPYKNDLPRGAYPSPNQDASPQASYSLFEKTDVWSENCRVLYEDAIRDRWASATDIPWDTLQPLPEHLERAVCQICTEMSEQAYVTVQVLSGWLERISYGFHEVKNFLATQIFDNARHAEAFRKRALANGGGLGIESPGIYHRMIAGAMKFTELVIGTNLVRATFNLVAIEALKGVATSEAERTLYGYVVRDLRRHIDYGVGHIQFVLARKPQMLGAVHHWLGRAEMLLVADQRRNAPFNEAFMLLLGENAADGRARFQEVRRSWVYTYLNRLADARVVDRIDKLAPEIKAFLPEGTAILTSVSLRPPVPDPMS